MSERYNHICRVLTKHMEKNGWNIDEDEDAIAFRHLDGHRIEFNKWSEVCAWMMKNLPDCG